LSNKPIDPGNLVVEGPPTRLTVLVPESDLVPNDPAATLFHGHFSIDVACHIERPVPMGSPLASLEGTRTWSRDRRMVMRQVLTPALAWVVLAGATLVPAAASESLDELLRQKINSEAFNLGVLVQVVGEAADSWDNVNNGVALANARVVMQGRLDSGVGYVVRTSLTKSPAMLDANLSLTTSPALRFTAGAFKSPFSVEFLIPASAIDFVNRSQVATLLAPGRQVGVEISGELARISYRLGAFRQRPRDRER
jgi:hypothetical protein